MWIVGHSFCQIGCSSQYIMMKRSMIFDHWRPTELSVMPRGKQHGLGHTPEYEAWHAMKQRCLNPKNSNYHNYGGRGITIAPEWLKFLPFYLHIGPKPSHLHSLDRLNVNLGYVPGNVKWSTKLEQEANKRRTFILTVDGVSRPLVDVAREHGFEGTQYLVIAQRFLRGWTPPELFRPIWISFQERLDRCL